MGFNLDDYETVETRIKRFYTDNPDGRITTEMINSAEGYKVAIFKAFVYLSDSTIPVSTGYAFEKDGDGYVNKTSHLENCETSAIGRALANYKYSGNKRPSREEMEKVKRGETKKPDSDLIKRLISYGKELDGISPEAYTKYRALYKQKKYKECEELYNKTIGVE